MQRIQNMKRVKGKYVNSEIDYDIVLSEEDIDALKEAEREIERGEVYELKDGMTLLDLLNDWREQYKAKWV